MLKRFFLWMQRDEGWKTVLAVVYAIICLVDFVIMPIAITAAKGTGWKEFVATELRHFDPAMQQQIVQAVTRDYAPFTLSGSGVFHLAFGALLTGSAIARKTSTEEK
jgi:hypothetical protein